MRFDCTDFFLSAGIARSIPIQIINTNAGRVMTAHSEQYEGKIYVGGLDEGICRTLLETGR
jgi:hypothetical protein